MFKRLYNWIKFKTLPSSVLFKNRLFVERDSKHRRVMSNFGLTFRNSKWSDYAIKNITMTSLTTFTRLLRNIFIFILLISFISSYSYYYNTNITYNNVTYLIWSFFEDLNYLVAYSFWTLTFTISFIIHTFYNKMFTLLYGTSIINQSQVQDYTLTSKLYKPSKNLQSPIFISFLTNSINSASNPQLLENLFHQTDLNRSWAIFYKSFKYLYYTNFNLLNINYPSHLVNSTLVNPTTSYPFLDLATFSNNSVINTVKNISDINYQQLTTSTNNEWNLYSFSNEITKYNNILIGKKNLFYLNKLNFNTLNDLMTNYTELFSLSQSLLDQTKVVKWNRWLYRYNVLHRKTIKNSHKLTMVKKLISTGFYDTSMMSNNMWTSTFFSKTTKPLFDKTTLDLLHSQFNLLYKDTFNNNQLVSNNFNELNLQSPSSPLNMLKYFEKSYFWFVKRFYMYNTLNTNNITSGIILDRNNSLDLVTDNLNSTFTKYSLLLNTLIRSFYLTNGNLNPTYPTINFLKNTNHHTSNSLKDITVVNNDVELFNVDNLEIVTNFNNLTNNYNTDFNFFTNNLYNNTIDNTTLNFNCTRTSNSDNIQLPYTMLNPDLKLLSDLYILMLLNK